jgi:hypothetical protein
VRERQVLGCGQDLDGPGAVADWESWTKMRFPETGDYVFPQGLAPVRIERERDLGVYWEPNIRVIHPIS